MNDLRGKPVLLHTIDHIISKCRPKLASFSCWIVAPEFDRGGLDFISEIYEDIEIYYGHDNSPLKRFVEVSRDLEDSDFLIRVNAMNYCFDEETLMKYLDIAIYNGLDSVRFPDDFPAIFTADIYSVKSLRNLAGELSADSPFQIHPKYFIDKFGGYRTVVAKPDLRAYTDEFLLSVRADCHDFMNVKRLEVDSSYSVKQADTISHHYEMALQFLGKESAVLDLACGSGFGCKILAKKATFVTGVDLDPSVIAYASKNIAINNLTFRVANVLDLPFQDESFDVVTAFEIIEHVNPINLLNEVVRVLRPGGLAILSTPQNCLGKIPTTPDHIIEYSLPELLGLIKEKLQILKVVGIKQGTICFENDLIGSNTFVVAFRGQ
jgi:2-polyprenyl-3-methyl-5-hydroxy-6-metoxy-1,4-benzoquinol methylase